MIRKALLFTRHKGVKLLLISAIVFLAGAVNENVIYNGIHIYRIITFLSAFTFGNAYLYFQDHYFNEEVFGIRTGRHVD